VGVQDRVVTHAPRPATVRQAFGEKARWCCDLANAPDGGERRRFHARRGPGQRADPDPAVDGCARALDATTRSSFSDRIHADAEALAQQNENRLRGLNVDELSNLNSTFQYPSKLDGSGSR
jgi:hypothetical protein